MEKELEVEAFTNVEERMSVGIGLDDSSGPYSAFCSRFRVREVRKLGVEQAGVRGMGLDGCS